MARFLSRALLLCLIAGLAEAQETVNKAKLASEINAISQNTMHRGVFYAGSQGGVHYFVVKWKFKPNRELRIPDQAFPIEDSMALTDDEKLWRSVNVSESPMAVNGEHLFTHEEKSYRIDSAKK